jgi:hypothetical protein
VISIAQVSKLLEMLLSTVHDTAFRKTSKQSLQLQLKGVKPQVFTYLKKLPKRSQELHLKPTLVVNI